MYVTDVFGKDPLEVGSGGALPPKFSEVVQLSAA
jgi:hypothetical protein